MKVEELRSLSLQELVDKEGELKKELFNLRFQKATGQIENPMRLRTTRKEIARVKTIINELKKRQD
ncbi:MAG: 50S ribosomal protein L29 [Candidatus Tectomicrobia bacterium]|uniref:Large ribosomal subunit protein uL29 n=1 Tax=Tectimicrobiota bacterium TaxID=2528274 RepID=A0A933GLL9_UNCTE|nr:50S ribosomal protein L29 [Candidatus Tectomicrobia bacterium]